MATLKDIAKLACVDISTVSRALNNTSYVHPDTKERIYAAAKELGYHPNAMAQALRQGKTYAIGVVIPYLHLTIFSEILHGIEKAAHDLGYATLICVTEDDPKIERESLSRLRNGFVDGIIVAATGRNGQLLRDIQASGITVVQLVRQQERKISSVVVDYASCGFEAVKFLYEKGCREIGIIDGARHLISYREQYDGYKKAITHFGLEEHVGKSNHPINSFEYGYESANQLLDDNPAIDGILAAVDIQGLGVIRALTERGIAIPKQIKVISLTGHAIGGMLETSMTSMEIPAQEMGEMAMKMVIDKIQTSSDQKFTPKHLTFSATLVEREST